MNLDQIKNYIKENEKLYNKETIKKRLRNNGAKPEDIKKAYSIFSFPEFEIKNIDDKKTIENFEKLSSDMENIFQNKKIMIGGILILVGLGYGISSIISTTAGLYILNRDSKEKEEKKINQIAKILKTIGVISLVISIITTLLLDETILNFLLELI